MGDFWSHLLDTTGFPPRWECGWAWTRFLGYLHIVSDITTALAYAIISTTLAATLIRKRRDLPRAGLVLGLLFSSFVFSCGSVHAVEAAIFTWPAYRLSGALKGVTAVVSIGTAVLLVRFIPRIASVPRITALNDRLRGQIHRRRELEGRARKDASELARLNSRLRRAAQSDPLTNLLNRRGLEQALRTELSRSRRADTRLTVVLVDLDDFKHINDTYGHDVGDAVLETIADRLGSAVRDVDVLGRVGGDEFLLLLHDARVVEAENLCERLRDQVSAPIATDSLRLEITACFAITEVSDLRTDVSGLLRMTTRLLKRSKDGGKNRVVVGDLRDREALHTVPSVLEVELGFARQPILDIGTLHPIGDEYLVRAHHEAVADPVLLFRAAREQGALVDLDLVCLRLAARLTRSRPGHRHYNVFPETLAERPDEVLGLFANGGRTDVCLEINENLLAGDPASLIRARRAAESSGIGIAIDDVGFGRSSLESLIVLEPDIVKIDRRFVHGAANDSVRRSHLIRILQVVDSLGSVAIAEGIEDASDRQVVLDAGVRLGQGYLWGRPVPT
jgi:diguanylate cyclase (GGDEF)-like protein